MVGDGGGSGIVSAMEIALIQLLLRRQLLYYVKVEVLDLLDYRRRDMGIFYTSLLVHLCVIWPGYQKFPLSYSYIAALLHHSLLGHDSD